MIKMKKKTFDIHETLMQLAMRWTETDNHLYEEGKRIENFLIERERHLEQISNLKEQIAKLETQLSVARSYTQTLRRQLDEISLRKKGTA